MKDLYRTSIGGVPAGILARAYLRRRRRARRALGGLLIRSSSQGSEPSADTSEYRQNTYGAPTHYVDPTKSTNGAGTSGDPWQPSQAMASAVAGNVVGWMNGVSHLIPTTDNDNIPALNPAASGTSGSRIVHVTRYAAAFLVTESDPDAILLDSRRTQIRTDALPEIAVEEPDGTGDGCPTLGSLSRNYITWDGFFIDMDDAHPCSDSGVIRAESCTGVQFRNMAIRGVTENMHSNPVLYRPGTAVDTVVHNMATWGFHNTGAGSTQPGLFSDQYGDQNFTLEYITMFDTDEGPFVKGAPLDVHNYGVMRYIKVYDAMTAFSFNATDVAQLTEAHHCLGYNLDATDTDGAAGIQFRNIDAGGLESVSVHHNTIHFTNTNGNGIGGLYSKGDGDGLGDGVELYDNIFALSSGGSGFGAMINLEGATVPDVMDHNFYYRPSGSYSWWSNSNQRTSISTWRTLMNPLEANANTFASTPFNNQAAGDFTIAPGHAALTASSTGGEVGCYEGGAWVGFYGSGAYD